MGAKFLVDAVLVALVEEIEVLFAERGQEGIRIVELADLTAVPRGAKLVGIDGLALRNEDLEETLGREQLHLNGGPCDEIDDRAGLGITNKSPDKHSLDFPLFVGTHAEEVVRSGVFCFDEGDEFGGAYDHDWVGVAESVPIVRNHVQNVFCESDKKDGVPDAVQINPCSSGRRKCR